jgi:putative ABC transport system permease protein
MALLRSAASGLRSLFRKKRVENDLDDELRNFLDMAAEEKIKEGMSRKEALRAVRLDRGSLEVSRELVRSAGWESLVEACWQDLRLGLRMLRKSPGFTAVAVLTLALGIGANTSIFSLINALMLRTVPVRDPGTLVELLHRYPGEPAFNGFSWDAYQIMRDHNHVLSDLIVDSPDSFVVRGQRLEPHRILGAYLSGTFFETLGLQAAIGRLIGTEADDLRHPSPVAVVSWSYWKSKFNLDPAILGRQIIVNDTPVMIVGVTEQGFSGLNGEMSQDVWLPLSMEPVAHHSALGWGSLGLVGRLKSGVSLRTARAEMAVLFQSVVEAPGVGPNVREMKFEMEPAANGLSTPLRQTLSTPLVVLMALVSLVLLIACANLAGLLLARGASRRQEMAVRACLGAGRFRLVRQALTESLLLSLLGSLLGVFLAYFGGRGLLRMLTSGREVLGLPMNVDILTKPDSYVLLFTGAIALLTALLFGAAPAMSLSTLSASALQQASRIGESRSRRLFGKSLIVSQVALSVVLLSAAAVFVGYVSHLRNLNLGFRRDHLLLVHLDPDHSGYDPAQWSRLSQELLAQLEALPGVRSATLSGVTPMLGAGASSFAVVKSHPENHREVSINFVAPNYFETYRTPLLAGRDFSFNDQRGPLLAIINQAMARDYFGTNSPIGSHVTLDHVTLRGNDTPTYEIVGVVGDAKYNDLQQVTPRTIYLNAFQENRIVSQLTLRTATDPEAAARVVRQSVASVMKTVPVVRVNTMNDQINSAIVPERLTATLSTWFGALGALLAAVGLYGLLAYTVIRRTNEIGVRMALGATTGIVMRMVLAEAFAMVGAGLLIGVPLALWTKQFATRLIPDLTAQGALSILLGAVTMLAIGLLAAYPPARRASRVEPIVALRYE